MSESTTTVDRNRLIRHLQRIQCGGSIRSATFSRDLGAVALCEDHRLMVAAPALEGIEPLGREFGIPDLRLLTRALKDLSGGRNGPSQVGLRIDDDHLIVDEGDRGTLYIGTEDPDEIRTRVDPSIAEQLLTQAQSLQEQEGVPLLPRAISGIAKMWSRFKANEVKLSVGRDRVWVTIISFHSPRRDAARADIPLLGSIGGQVAYSVSLDEHFVKTLSTIKDSSTARLLLGGPKYFALVADGDYLFLLSPIDPGTDRSESYWRTRKRDPVPA